MGDDVQVNFRPIGRVTNGITDRRQRGWREVESEIVLDPDLAPSLDGIEGFSHVIVVYWLHESTGEPPLKVHPQGRAELPLTGVLATRSPHRPNPIGLTVVQLLRRENHTLRVKGLDAWNGTPVLDIKPYLPRDAIARARYPDWVSKLEDR